MHVHLVKSFTTDPDAGSATGVVLDAEALHDEEMMAAANVLGFPETAFVTGSSVADARVRFFSPRREVEFCGYATLATAHVLSECGRAVRETSGRVRLLLETGVGPIPVLRNSDGVIIMRQRAPEFRPPECDRSRVAALLGIDLDAITDAPIQTVSTGTPKLLVPLRRLAALRAVVPDLDGIEAYDAETGNRGFYPFTAETLDPLHDFIARQFNPTFDRNEDPITGVAAGALASYAHRYLSPAQEVYTIEQGFFLGKGGTMTVDLRGGVHVGGEAVTFGERDL